MKSSPAKLFGGKQRKAKDFEAEQIAKMSGMALDKESMKDEKKSIKKYMLKGKKYDV